jgi:uncharacterized membrane protein
MKSTRTRSLVKAILYRFVGSLATFLIALLFTGEIIISGGIAVVELASKIFLYYFYERAWNLVSWGRQNNLSTNKGVEGV